MLLFAGCMAGGEPLAPHLLAAAKDGDEVRVLVWRGPSYNWSSPRALALSAAISGSDFFGHTINVLRINGRETFASMTDTPQAIGQYQAAIFEDGRGLGALLDVYPGRFVQDPEETARTIDRLIETYGHPRVIRMPLRDPNRAGAVREFVAKFARSEGATRYGLTPDPREYEGAGCTSLSIELLRRGGLEDLRALPWQRRIRIPEPLIGTPVRPAPPLQLVVSGGRWAEDYEPGRELSIIDPTLLYEWAASHANTNGIASVYPEDF